MPKNAFTFQVMQLLAQICYKRFVLGAFTNSLAQIRFNDVLYVPVCVMVYVCAKFSSGTTEAKVMKLGD